MENKYDDIINLPHHVSENHKRMDKINRAAQFAPFAALTGYAEAINEAGRVVDKKIILSNEEKEKISNILSYLNLHIKEDIIVTIVYFIKDNLKEGGSYNSITSSLKKIDEFNKIIELKNKIKIKINDIYKINVDIFNEFND
jgi:hypothetical protein